MILRRPTLLAFLLLGALPALGQTPLADAPPVRFALTDVQAAADERGLDLVLPGEEGEGTSVRIELDEALGSQAYRITSEDGDVRLVGGGEAGLMYAGFDLAERIRMGADVGSLPAIEQAPFVEKRGIKFNIPLDARTPSYDDTGDAAQRNIETVWDFAFWERFLDELARDRYNLLTLWSLHPYPSMVRVPGYEDVALDDVAVFTGPIDAKTDMKWRGRGIQNPDSLRIVKRLSMDEKMAFWQRVFTHAQERDIDVYLFHWNVFVNGAEGKYGISWEQDDPETVDYLRASVKAFLLAYPMVKGIGVTAGEHIDRDLTGEYATENWMWQTYGRGVMEAKAENPDLDVRFIFRRHWSDLGDIRAAFADYDGPFETSFKYSRARMYSSVRPPWFDRIFREDVERHGMKTWLNIRNDDLFVFRWGDPAYARQYLRNLPHDVLAGFYMGPDGYVWGREFVSQRPQTPRQFEIDKHWYRFMIWGRLAYDPALPPDFFVSKIREHFPSIDAERMYATWRATSEIIRWVDQVHFRQNDFQFAPEAGFDKDDGFHDVNRFIEIGAMPEQGVASIATFARGEADPADLTPFQVADSLDVAAAVLLEGAKALNAGDDAELQETLADFQALGHLGRYYAAKIRGATRVARYRLGGDSADQQQAIADLEAAATAWDAYADVAAATYTPQLLARTRHLDWYAIAADVRRDVEIARTAQPGEAVDPPEDNILWDRDRRRF
ncbi:MAG: carbohydrate-binding family 6 protein [Rhodothermales bacterium]